MSQNQFYIAPRSLGSDGRPQPGGLCSIYFAPVEDVTSIPKASPGTATIGGPIPILLRAGKSWFRLYGQPKRSYRHDQRAGDGGTFIETTVTGALPFDNPDNHLTLDRLKYHKFIVVVTRPDGTQRVVGSRDNPCLLQHNTDTGSSHADSAGTEVRFVWTSEDLAPIYTGDVTPVA